MNKTEDLFIMPPNYQNGKIYKLVNTNNRIIYIGSTTCALSVRMGNHRSVGKLLSRPSPIYQAMHDLGVDTFNIILVKDAPCSSKEELNAIEDATMNEFLAEGYTLYNQRIDGTHSEQTKKLMSKLAMGSANVMYGKTGYASASFTRGSVYHREGRWIFEWRENNKKRSRSFSDKKFTNTGAKKLAIAVQNEIFPTE